MVDSIHKPGGRSEWSLARCVYYGGLDLESAQPRNVFVLFDGTWNDEAGGSRTNVHKLWDALEENERQVKHYFRGVGNDEQNGLFWRAVGGFTGIGERRIRRDAYSTLALDHRAGDRLFILGFSRGAGSARLLASDLHRVGLPQRVRVTRKGKRNRRAWERIEERFVSFDPVAPYLRPIDVHFLGVWDTVGAFGVPVEILGFNIRTPKSRVFRDNTIAENVRHATHCVAIDETRDAFEPTLFNHKPGVVDEVWFAGVHSDVGGGYRRDQDRLGDHTLRYMAAAVRSAAACDHAHAGAPPGDAGCAGTTPLPAEFDEPKLARRLPQRPARHHAAHARPRLEQVAPRRARAPSRRGRTTGGEPADPRLRARPRRPRRHVRPATLRTASRPAPHRELRARPARPARRAARARPVAAIPPRAPPRRRSSSNSEAAETSTTRATPAARARQQALATRARDATDHIVGDHSTPV